MSLSAVVSQPQHFIGFATLMLQHEVQYQYFTPSSAGLYLTFVISLRRSNYLNFMALMHTGFFKEFCRKGRKKQLLG